MAQYDTVVKQVTDDITVTVSKKKDGTAGDRLIAFLKWLADNASNRPDQGLPGGGGGGRPDQGLPPGPDQGLPGGGGSGGKPDNTLPGAPGKPDQGLPGGGGSGGRPDNSLPGIIGDNAEAIAKVILAACFDCKKPDNTLPGSGGAQPKK